MVLVGGAGDGRGRCLGQLPPPGPSPHHVDGRPGQQHGGEGGDGVDHLAPAQRPPRPAQHLLGEVVGEGGGQAVAVEGPAHPGGALPGAQPGGHPLEGGGPLDGVGAGARPHALIVAQSGAV